MTEGRGPSVLDSIWDNRIEAERFMDEQPGVMGRPGPWSDKKVGRDWYIEEVTVFSNAKDKVDEEQKKLIRKALRKLTEEEIDALNITHLLYEN